jgi:hypothetical protein
MAVDLGRIGGGPVFWIQENIVLKAQVLSIRKAEATA